MNDEIAVSFRNVSIVFGPKTDEALAMIDAGRPRDEVRAQTGATVGVANASLDVRRGEIAVLMGLSGSGKSTLIRAVNGLAPVARGSVIVDTGGRQTDPAACSSSSLRMLRRGGVAMVFQQFGLLPWRTVIENVGLGLQFAGVSKAERRERARAQLDLVGLSDWGDRRVNELSGGMQQRVGVVRALANNPAVLLMDEPFASVDAQTRMTLQEELTRIWQERKPTVIFITHDVAEAVFLANRVVVLSKGRVLDQIKVDLPRPRVWDELMEDETFKRLSAQVLQMVRAA